MVSPELPPTDLFQLPERDDTLTYDPSRLCRCSLILIDPSWLVALDIGQPHLNQDAADVLALEFDGAIGSTRQEWHQSLSVPRLLVGLPLQFGFEHGEVIRHDEPNLLIRPVTGGIGILDGLTFALPNDRESQLSEDEVCLPRCLTAAELLGQQHSTQGVPARQADNGFGRVSLPLVQKLVNRRLTERMIDAGIEVG
jgi:hypothetical protein